MFDKLDLKPRSFARMQKLDCGSQVPNPNKQLVHPTPFGKERAQEIIDAAKAATICGPWSDKLRDVMTDGEIVYVLAVWDCCSGSSSFMSAFYHVLQGNIEAYQEAFKKANLYIERGSRESLNVWMSGLPAPARKDYVLEYIGGMEWGIRPVGANQ